jgi:transcription elongation factor Elf1
MIPSLICPRCHRPLSFKLIVPPKYTKSLRCDHCRIRVSMPIDDFVKEVNKYWR